jgi:hypothetical protein
MFWEMAQKRTRKEKANPHYEFLVSWSPKEGGVKGELDSVKSSSEPTGVRAKRAMLLAKEGTGTPIKKAIVKSLVSVSFILILELVIYLAWSRFR